VTGSAARNRGSASLWIPVVLYMGFIFALSSRTHVPDLPGGISDKSGHALLYFGLAALLVRWLAGGIGAPVASGTAVLAWALATLYGATDELHQFWVPPRTMDVFDLMADAGGAAAASLLAYSWARLSRRRAAE
jgi:VanZ family protein